MDPWVILPQERMRHMEQFTTVGPKDGFITGAQARGFFMQSGLPPMVLAQIWGLADMNGDGKMDLNEFSVACKLINLKLKGMEIPKNLPPQLLASGNNAAAMGMGGGMMPPNSLPLQGMGMPGMGMNMGMGMPGMMGGMPGQMGGMPGQMGMPGAMMGGMGMPGMMGGMPGMPPNSMPGMMPNASMGGMMPPGSQAAIPGVQPSVVMPPANPTPPPIEWSIPQQKRVQYMAQFQANDKAKTGFLAAVQARTILLQTGLAQQTLASVWNMSDIDKDGKLNVEEFILAMHLCEMGQKGEPLPDPLPINLVPPSLRRAFMNGSAAGTPGSVTSAQGMAPAPGMASPASFEDKRRENWEAGQAELQKRRESLMEQQKKEKEEREKKEKEEKELREKQKREAEARRQAELEARRQRELEQQRMMEEQKRRAEEHREQARKEMEKQKLLEWENSRKIELEQHRQRETENVINLRAKKESIGAEFEAIKNKVDDLTTKIADTRTGVTDVKQFIDGMRTSRDTKMAELNALKTQLKEQNQRLLQVTQERAKIESKNKVNQKQMEGNLVVELTDFDLKKAEKAEQVAALKEQFAVIKVEEEAKKEELENNKKILLEHREKLSKMIEACKALHEGFDEKRKEVRAEKNKKIRELTDPDHAWGGGFDSPSFSNPTSPVTNAAPIVEPVAADPDPFADPFASESAPVPAETEPESTPAPAAATDLSNYVKYKALYDYDARNADELSFKANDLIMVHPGQDHEPGWLGGELDGKVGWFPEAYAERYVEGATDNTLQPIAEVAENGSDTSSWQDVDQQLAAGPADKQPAVDEAAAVEAAATSEPSPATVTEVLNEKFVSVYPYNSDEPGDLVFDAGENITVTAKNGDWWTGTIGDRSGVFPFNYVEPAPEDGEVQSSMAAPADGSFEAADISAAQAVPPAADLSVSDAEKIVKVKKEKSKKDKSGKKLELATVIAPYEATSKEQLTLAKGQMIIIKKKSDTGWWQGELQSGGKGKKRAVGWFPASYVKLLAGGEANSAADTSVASSNGSAGGEKYTAVYTYAAQYEDELSFEAGETVTVVNKDEADWWKGECNGKSGVFPSNYVEPLKFQKSASEKKRQNLIDELYQTEVAYVDNLKLVFEVFIKSIRASNMLSKQELSILFINWKDLIVTNTKLLKSMRIRQTMNQDQTTIGDILCENFPAMTAYIRFCSSQMSAAALLQRLVETKPEFDSLLRQCQAHGRVQGMPLSFYLLKPVKRVTEYPLLVEKLLKNTPEEHPDFIYTQEALNRAKILCDQVNEGMRMKENSERLEWLQIHVDLQAEEKVLQEKITFNSLTNSVGPRKFLHCGVLKKTKSEKELVCFLFNDFILLVTANTTFNGQQFSFDKHFNVNMKIYRQPLFLNAVSIGASLRKEEDNIGFSLKHGDVVLGLDCLNVNDKTLWNSKISEALSNYAANEKKFLTKQKSVHENETKESKGRLLLIIVKGENFLKTDGARSYVSQGSLTLVILSSNKLACPKSKGCVQSYCEAAMGSQEQKTAVVQGPSPHWNASMQFLIKDINQDILCLTVFDRDFFSPDEFLGRTEIKISDIVGGCDERRGPVTRTLKLLEAESGVITVKLDIQLF